MILFGGVARYLNGEKTIKIFSIENNKFAYPHKGKRIWTNGRNVLFIQSRLHIGSVPERKMSETFSKFLCFCSVWPSLKLMQRNKKKWRSYFENQNQTISTVPHFGRERPRLCGRFPSWHCWSPEVRHKNRGIRWQWSLFAFAIVYWRSLWAEVPCWPALSTHLKRFTLLSEQ